MPAANATAAAMTGTGRKSGYRRQYPETGPKRRERSLTHRSCLFRREFPGLAIPRTAQRFQPFSEPTPEGSGQFIAAGWLTIECRTPFDECPITIQNGGNAQGRLEVGERQGWRATEFVGLRLLYIRQRQQPLPNAAFLIEHVPDRPGHAREWPPPRNRLKFPSKPPLSTSEPPDRAVLELAQSLGTSGEDSRDDSRAGRRSGGPRGGRSD